MADEDYNGANDVSDKLTIFGKSFWDMWVQKVLRNIASVKYQFMAAFFYLISHGMFVAKGTDGNFLISPTEGLAFLSAGFISLATSRIVMRTSLFEPRNSDELDTDK